jgi:hypothetical protein
MSTETELAVTEALSRAAKVCKHPSVYFQSLSGECCIYDGFGITRQRTAKVIERVMTETESAIRALIPAALSRGIDLLSRQMARAESAGQDYDHD